MKKYNVYRLSVVKVGEERNVRYLICEYEVRTNTYTEVLTKEKLKVSDKKCVEPLTNYYSLITQCNYSTAKPLMLGRKELLQKYKEINGETTLIYNDEETKNTLEEQTNKKENTSCKKILIPTGGTINWLRNCEERGYECNGYSGHIVSEIIISPDSRITISDYTQPSKFGKKEFFTSITFYKKELDNHSIYAPKIYERAYSIYYPYGTRFNEKLLKKIGRALSVLMNEARDLSLTEINGDKLLKDIFNKQKQLIDLFLNGTNDIMAVEKIVGMKKMVVDGHIREANITKDWLPYFATRGLFSDAHELEQEKILKK